MKRWTADDVLTLGRAYQRAAVLAAAADLELFEALEPKPLTAAQTARKLRCDLRGISILLDALAALQLVDKDGDSYALPAALSPLLTPKGRQSVLAMSQHHSNCLRMWAQLARVVKSGKPAERTPSVRGEAADQAAFIGAMNDISAPEADKVIKAIRPLKFHHLLDIGGASGTWTIAFLRACPEAKATLFDLPHVIPMARRRFRAAKLNRQVRFVSGDFTTDQLPFGSDFAWVSAIVHMQSREENRHLFANIFHALEPGGRIAIRDILMDKTHTKPGAGALFAVNMLVATPNGTTFTFDELREDLETAGFRDAVVARHDEWMSSIVVAQKV